MAAEIKSKGKKVETFLSSSLKKKFQRKCKTGNTSMSQCIRDLVQAYVKTN